MAHDPFAPPSEDNRPLEIEKEWGEEKVAKQATAVVHDAAPPKRSNRWIWVAIGLVVGGVLAAGIVVQLNANKHHVDHGTLPATEGSVAIEIRSGKPAVIRIDGSKAGKTPLTLHVRKGTTPVRIDNGTETKTVIPDHDQRIEFTR